MAGKKQSERKVINDYSDDTISKLFGCNRNIMTTLWNLISPLNLFYQEDLIRLMDFITNYQSMFVLATNYSISEKTLRERLWFCLERLTDKIPPIDIRFRFISNHGTKNLKFAANPGSYCLTAIDSSGFPFQSSDKKFISARHENRTELKYQMLVNISNGMVCHVHGPCPSNMDDITLYHKDYSGEERLICPIDKAQPNLDTNEELYNMWVSSKRKCIKNVFKKYKRYKSMSSPFRSDGEKHFRIVKLITYIININIAGDLLDEEQLPSTFLYSERYHTAQHEDVPFTSSTPVSSSAPYTSSVPVALGAPFNSNKPVAAVVPLISSVPAAPFISSTATTPVALGAPFASSKPVAPVVPFISSTPVATAVTQRTSISHYLSTDDVTFSTAESQLSSPFYQKPQSPISSQTQYNLHSNLLSPPLTPRTTL
ncbi:hypothetical protein DICPUDRAFT_84156 [Dictyostelium purpureum]|uniref:DDE Tnp4 domain-containing protein n=1 Tax=Dictyostelium purpureum TaxID=5786 RepID=F1A1R3_DICPU|nr:uncharacterized protein DICPUDRAFT_84156 [Dictyostelium purpureum]EGC29872.1 hypothetical protein DICPUDRAFT_84156 [Dictyostelium purpureum]|eukprot:XP_003293609.1 hypothetical protein DICPUDRAFT_84156 [Dictyostelium purpureum]